MAPKPPTGGAPTATPAHFDQAAAAAAISALEDTVNLLQGQRPRRDGLATTALKNWKGPDADTFRSQRYPAIKAQTASTIQQLNNLITTISDASAKAAAATAAGGGGGGGLARRSVN